MAKFTEVYERMISESSLIVEIGGREYSIDTGNELVMENIFGTLLAYFKDSATQKRVKEIMDASKGRRLNASERSDIVKLVKGVRDEKLQGKLAKEIDVKNFIGSQETVPVTVRNPGHYVEKDKPKREDK